MLLLLATLVFGQPESAAELSRALAGPSGKYEGNKKILGKHIYASMTYGADGAMEFILQGPLAVDCVGEPFTIDSNVVTLSNVENDDDCIKKTLSDNKSKLLSINYESLFDELSVKVKYRFVTVNFQLSKTAFASEAESSRALQLAMAQTFSDELFQPLAGPAGKYEGNKKILGKHIYASMTYGADGKMEFILQGPLAVDCTEEPFTVASNVVTLSNVENDDDCIKKTLSGNKSKLLSIKYESLFDELTVKVKYRFVTVNFQLSKTAFALSAESSTALQLALGFSDDAELFRPLAGPTGKYEGNKKILGKHIYASMTYGADGKMEFILQGPLAVDCTGEPFSVASNVVTLSNVENDDDCIKKTLSDNKSKLLSINYEALFDELTVKVKYRFVTVNFQLSKTASEVAAKSEKRLFASTMHYRIEARGPHLKVESCRNIAEGLYGDPEGTCQEHGFTSACSSCYGSLEFFVKDATTCTQKTTECYFKGQGETCTGMSQCQFGDDEESLLAPAPVTERALIYPDGFYEGYFSKYGNKVWANMTITKTHFEVNLHGKMKMHCNKKGDKQDNGKDHSEAYTLKWKSNNNNEEWEVLDVTEYGGILDCFTESLKANKANVNALLYRPKRDQFSLQMKVKGHNLSMDLKKPKKGEELESRYALE